MTVNPAGLLERGFEGTIAGRSGDTLVLLPRLGGPARTFLPDSDSLLFVFAGNHSMLMRGALIGTMAGLVAGGVVGMVAGKVCNTSDPLCSTRRQVVGRAAFLLGGCGLATGLLIGVLASHEDWMHSQEYWAARPVISAGPHGMQLGLTVPF
jgi:hypothetical protein